MNLRVQKLRQESLEAVPTISVERARLLTEVYQNAPTLKSYSVQRALAFEYLLSNKEICINDHELIVGERGPVPKGTPTYPEICCHSLADLDLLNTRKKIPYKVDKASRRLYETTIIPYWRGGTIREKVFSEMTQNWIDAYEAGIFTEFMEQRAPGHTVLDDKIYKMGMLDFMKKIESNLQALDYLNDAGAYHKQDELQAMAICARALIHYAERHAEKALEIAERETNPTRKAELEQIAEVCTRVPAHAPRNFWEALQYYWFVHLGVIIELNTWDAFNPGRLDQHLYPFYKAGVEDGTFTRESALELLQCFWIKFNNQPAPPKVGVTAAESGTYTDFATINTGGLKPDGSDAVNDVTYMILEVIQEMRLLQPSSNLQLSKKNPDRFLKKAVEIIKTGYGQPSIFNADVVVQEMVRAGKSIEDARNGGTSGCVETGAFGKENYNLTGYFNLPKVLEVTLNNGIDPRTGKFIGIQTGNPRDFSSFDELWNAYERQLKWFIDIKIRGNNVIERIYATYLPVPFLSLLIDDCIDNGLDYHDGGARYNTSYIQGVGLGSITDMLTAIKYHVYDRESMDMDTFLEILRVNYEGHEVVRQRLLNKTPKYGNDDDYADQIMQKVFEAYFASIDGRKNTKGGNYHIDLLPTTVHMYFGSVVGATPDGRKAWEPLSEGISPVQGADRHGPTAVINSAAKMDHIRTGGTLLNQKFTPQLLADQAGRDKLVHFIRSYFKKDGHHIQFNVVDVETLRAAQQNPEKYRDLIVRVAGYSDYFCDLSEALQEEIITRTEQTEF
jgi:pyruvate formate-lyase/glycerol dehydratase family glycyl radical enzyme